MATGVPDRDVREALAALASPARAPAAGVAAALSAALAASLLELSAGLAARRLDGGGQGADPGAAARMAELATRAGRLRAELPDLATADAEAYAAVAEALEGPGRAEALGRATDPPLSIAEAAAELAQGAADVCELARADWPFAPDAAVARELAVAATRCAASLVIANAPDDPRAARAREAASRAASVAGKLV